MLILVVSGSLWRAVRIAAIDLISTANGKALGAAAFERTDVPFTENFVQTLHDEALEPFWATTVSSMLAEFSTRITPWVPEQIAIIPGKLLGEAWHWLITSDQSTNKGALRGATNGNGKSDSILASFFDTFVKKPSDLVLRLCGMNEKEGNFLWYTLSQLGFVGLASYSLTGDDEENLPGVNIDTSDSFLAATAKGVGYTLVEQGTYAISQTLRFFIDFREEFGWKKGENISFSEKKQVWGKVLANVVNERLLPGHIFLGMSSGLSTYYLRKVFDWMPRTTAAAIGEFPMSLLNRMINCRDRRATKDKIEIDENGKKKYKLDESGNKIANYRFSDSKVFNSILDGWDSVIKKPKELMLSWLAAAFCGDKDKEQYKKELICTTKERNLDKVT